MLEHALAAAARNWAVHPLQDKRPILHSWPQAASVDASQVRRWFEGASPSTSYGIVCGRSGLLILDVDGEAGYASLEIAEDELGPLPTTMTVQTARGEHRYFQDPGNAGNGQIKWRPGLDVLAGDRYAVGPGSAVGETTYHLLDQECIGNAEVASLPAAWCEAMRVGESMAPVRTSSSSNPIPNEDTVATGATAATGAAEVAQIFTSMPLDKRHQCHRLVFKLAQRLCPLYPDTETPPQALLDQLRHWYVDGKHNTEKSWADVCSNFLAAWTAVDPERSILAKALSSADARGCPQEIADQFPDPEDQTFRRLAALAFELQLQSGSEPFYLAQTEAARLLGIARQTVTTYLRLLREPHGPLELVRPFSYTEGRANEYRWKNHNATTGA